MERLTNPSYNATCLKGDRNGHNDPKPDNPRDVKAARDVIKGAEGRFPRSDRVPTKLFLYDNLDQATDNDHPQRVEPNGCAKRSSSNQLP
jgi:hypothetical protein